MRSVGYRAVLAGVALLSACASGWARAPDSQDLNATSLQPWNYYAQQYPEYGEDLDVDNIAQQAPAPAAATTEPGPTTPAPDSNAPPDSASTEPPVEDDVLPDLSGEPMADDFSVGEIPVVEIVELTPDTARKSLDAYVLVREKFKDAALENYENLQDFVEQDVKGKEFETDIKSFGFADVNQWNIAITTVGFAYSNLQDNQTADIKQQIEEVKADTEMALDMRERMVQALSAMIPSDNNRKIVDEMMKDANFAEKLKLLETEEE